jgi:hypothetical protein
VTLLNNHLTQFLELVGTANNQSSFDPIKFDMKTFIDKKFCKTQQEVQNIYNELVIYGHRAKKHRQLIDALLVSFIYFFKLSQNAIMEVEWNSLLITKVQKIIKKGTKILKEGSQEKQVDDFLRFKGQDILQNTYKNEECYNKKYYIRLPDENTKCQD